MIEFAYFNLLRAVRRSYHLCVFAIKVSTSYILLATLLYIILCFCDVEGAAQRHLTLTGLYQY